MNFKEKLKPKKLNVILFLIGFLLTDIIMATLMNPIVSCLDSPCGTELLFEPINLLVSIIAGLIFYLIGSFVGKNKV